MPASGDAAAFELVSGPDLGGGFLHQLTVERFSGVHQFVYHAQDGGPDANGPPVGPPGPFGYRVRATMCPIGGRVCWHREFTLPLTDSLRVRAAYNRTRFVMEAMLAQSYGGVVPPIAEAAKELADRLRTVEPVVPWYLTGLGALWARGAPVQPRSLELGTSPEAVARIAEAVKDYLTEPAGPTEWDGRPVLAARAFVGTLRAGVRVGWAVPLDDAAFARWSEETILARGLAPVRVEREGLPLSVAPLEATAVALAEARAEDDLAGTGPWMRTQSWDPGRLERFLAASTVPEERRRSLRKFADGPGSGAAPSLGS
jgi:hypothetical protein